MNSMKILNLVKTKLPADCFEKTKSGSFKVKESANDFTIKVWEANKKFKIGEYLDKTIEVAITCGVTFGNTPQDRNKFLANPFKSVKDPKDRAILAKRLASLNEKYDSFGWIKICQTYYQNFFSIRDGYFINQFIKNSELLSNVLTAAGTDHVIERWFDRTLENDKNQIYTIIYEDADGVIKEIRVKYKDVDIDENGVVSAAPITKYIGVTSYDNMILKYFYDLNSRSWVGVPLRLILSVESEGGENAFIRFGDKPDVESNNEESD